MIQDGYATLDELDRRIVVALQHDGRATWRAIAHAVGASTATVARRGQALLSSGLVKIAVTPALGSRGPVDPFLVRINCRPGSQIDVAAALAEHPDVRFVTLVTGRYDIVAELVVPGGAARYPQLIADLQSIEGVERWRSDLILHVHKLAFDWGRQLFEQQMDQPPAPRDDTPPAVDPTAFDAADWRIIDHLEHDGRETFQGVADHLGMNESSVRRRFERLRASGAINILTLVPAPALGMGAETLLTISIEPRHIAEVARELAQHPAVRYLASILDQSALFCEVILPSTDHLYRFIGESLSNMRGVTGWEASMELLYLKRGFVQTPWWRRQAVRVPAAREA